MAEQPRSSTAVQINNACDTRTKREAHSEGKRLVKGRAWGLLVSYNASRAILGRPQCENSEKT